MDNIFSKEKKKETGTFKDIYMQAFSLDLETCQEICQLKGDCALLPTNHQGFEGSMKGYGRASFYVL